MDAAAHDDLLFSVRYGLTQGLGLVRGMRRVLTEDERRTIAREIVAHLLRSNYVITKGPPLEGHGQAYNFRPD